MLQFEAFSTKGFSDIDLIILDNASIDNTDAEAIAFTDRRVS